MITIPIIQSAAKQNSHKKLGLRDREEHGLHMKVKPTLPNALYILAGVAKIPVPIHGRYRMRMGLDLINASGRTNNHVDLQDNHQSVILSTAIEHLHPH